MSTPDITSVSSSYDALALDFERHASQSVYNAYYDRPAVLSLLPSIQGKRVLDIGCGPGLYAAWFIEHGAQVVGFDISGEMVERARLRVGDRGTFYQHDISQPLTFAADASFDIAVAPLMIHHVNARVTALREVARVLTADGYLIVSTSHPFADWKQHGGSYFATELVQDTWYSSSSEAFQMPYWRVSLTTLCDEFSQAGFFIDRLLEPQPEAAAAEIDPKIYHELMEQPGFIVFRLQKRRGV
ncbi:methyltransferase [Reticulibacter mediterranei]|uniref:Methyltransferase n=1 Tax=Reticulibacter mediterranei TaxID=2778369 RepID=A0A8J3IED5_9CHLR|nr:class I SAM-dependent methyltransferase [Reticulibacter mediterranei]GHO90057.1 methyltransferase [Reticulibacter mediterranei]